MNDPASRPAIAEPVQDMAQYDTVFVGFPVWWYVEPRIVDTFLESYDFSGKAEKSLQSHCPAANWERGKLLNGSGAADWAKRMLHS